VAQLDNEIGGDAPGDVGKSYYYYSGSPAAWGYAGNWFGSSFAAPIVAGAAGLLRDLFYEWGYGIKANYYLKTDLMMLTDGYNFTSYTDGGTQRLTAGGSQFSGLGRLQLRTLGFANGNWQWSWFTLNINTGTTWSKTFPANIQHYRFAMFWSEADLTKVGDIDVKVDALDQYGNICQSQIAQQSDFSIVNAIHLTAADIPACALPSGSLKLTIIGFAVPSTRVIYASDLWDSETTY
jgi:hypothetical protein